MTHRKDSSEHSDAYESLFKALAHPVRRRILMTLNFEGGELPAGAIAEMFKQSWPTTTRHLSVLQEAGLIERKREGRSQIYRIRRQQLSLAQDWIAWFFKDPIGKT